MIYSRGCSCRRTERTSKGNHRTGDRGTTSTIRAIPQAIAEVDILAEAGRLGASASKLRVLCQHVVEASLPARREPSYTADCRDGYSSCRRTVRGAKCNHSTGYCGTAGAVGTVPDAIAEVDVFAEAAGVRGGAPQLRVLGEHIVEAGLSTGRKCSDSCYYGACRATSRRRRCPGAACRRRWFGTTCRRRCPGTA